MNSFMVLLFKELKEQIKTYKGVVLFIVALLFGMTSPLLAKLTPEIIKMAAVGVDIKIPIPTVLDAYMQFFKNISQMVLIILLLIYSSSVVSETLHGTASLILTKKLSRSAFILSKFLSAATVWTVSYIFSAALCFVYTCYLFPGGRTKELLLSLSCMWLFGIITLAAAILSSTLFKNYALAAVGGFCLWGLTLLTGSIPKIKEYTPALLGSDNVQLLAGTLSPDKMTIPFIAGVVFCALLLGVACLVFSRREL